MRKTARNVEKRAEKKKANIIGTQHGIICSLQLKANNIVGNGRTGKRGEISLKENKQPVTRKKLQVFSLLVVEIA